MTPKSCCRTCKHCVPAQSALFSLCKLRRIKIHNEIGIFAFCHHWGKKEPSLPIVNNQVTDKVADKQLDFGKVLVCSDN